MNQTKRLLLYSSFASFLKVQGVAFVVNETTGQGKVESSEMQWNVQDCLKYQDFPNYLPICLVINAKMKKKGDKSELQLKKTLKRFHGIMN